MFDKQGVLFGLTVFLGIIVIMRVLPPSVAQNLTMTVIEQKERIRSIDTPRLPASQRSLCVDGIAFARGKELIHEKIGPLGYTEDFFIDFNGRFLVETPGTYEFTVSSDDGYRLEIDGIVVGEFPADRPYASDNYLVTLERGTHIFTLHYFQGFGNLGLLAEFKPPKSETRYIVGQASREMRFLGCDKTVLQ